MTTEALVFPDPPTVTNGNDGNQDYNLGIRFSVDESVSCVGVRWVRTPDFITSTPNGGSHVAAVWTVVGETRVAFKNFTPPPAGADNFDVLFDTPITLDPSPTLYVVSIFTRDYVFRASVGAQLDSPSGTMQADQGKLASSGDPLTYPASNQAAYYYISPIIDLGGEESHDTTGTGFLTVAASAVTGASKPSTGTAALTAEATATRSTARVTTGVGPVALAASASLSSARVTTGRAELAAGASASRSTSRTTTGSARVLLAARAEQVRGGGGPRLITVSRPRAISTTTRG